MSTNGKGVALEDFLAAGGKLPKGENTKHTDPAKVQKYAMKIVGVLANAPDQATRVQALGKAMAMIVRPYRRKPE
ncbi:hypothetical protein LCGC14_0481130 [marine sediment metagenome]|uniref:Uncharacterized protein n=1 Tax=marine sediment metagenome TaxID=412755 RepID=A0A0F9SEN9_9ZZZZ